MMGYQAGVQDSRRTDHFGKPLAAHVPPELLRPIDWFGDDPFAIARELRDEVPLVYTLRNAFLGQSWVPARADIIRKVAGDPALFSSRDQSGFAQLVNETWQLLPLEADPPEHGFYRKILNPMFAPPAVARLTDIVADRAKSLVASFAGDDGCEFIHQYADIFPVQIFLDLMGWPQEHREMCQKWNYALIHAENPEERAENIRAITGYLRDIIADRRRAPRDDITSTILSADIAGRPISDDEALGMLTLLFGGGLDTVTAALSFQIWALAENQDLQQRLRNNPEEIPNAIEELLRYYGLSVNHRRATADTELAGHQIKQGDWISLIWAAANLDPTEVDDPDLVEIDRQRNRHMTFSFGPHFCVGNHLARRELLYSIRELLTQLPPFRLADPQSVRVCGGATFAVNRLKLRWD
jgi:cytochrome P450